MSLLDCEGLAASSSQHSRAHIGLQCGRHETRRGLRHEARSKAGSWRHEARCKVGLMEADSVVPTGLGEACGMKLAAREGLRRQAVLPPLD